MLTNVTGVCVCTFAVLNRLGGVREGFLEKPTFEQAKT